MSIEEILLNRVKVIGDGEWVLLGTPNDVIKELEAQKAEWEREARIYELDHFNLAIHSPNTTLDEYNKQVEDYRRCRIAELSKEQITKEHNDEN